MRHSIESLLEIKVDDITGFFVVDYSNPLVEAGKELGRGRTEREEAKLVWREKFEMVTVVNNFVCNLLL